MSGSAERLASILSAGGPPIIAVSGGIDSITLATFTHGLRQDGRMVHAVSPAVTQAATARVKELAALQGWRLTIVDAGEFADPSYLANPVNRCYFCKHNLYSTLRKLGDGIIMSGANKDDLGDYRPGLVAAQEHGVRHPYVEAEMDKASIRALARQSGLGDLAEIAASPCLSSRIETGIPVDIRTLALVEAVEAWLTASWGATIARCRFRTDGLEIELGPDELERATRDDALVEKLYAAVPQIDRYSVRLGPYRRGSAFLGKPTAVVK